MHLVVVILAANKFPDSPTCSLVGWLWVLLFGFQLELSDVLPVRDPPARPFRSCTRSKHTLYISSGSSKPRQALAQASGGGKEAAKCHHGYLWTLDSNPESTAATLGALMCVHCSLTLSLPAMGLLSCHPNWQPASPNSWKKHHSKRTAKGSRCGFGGPG